MINSKENLIVKLSLEFALDTISYPTTLKEKLLVIHNIISKIISTSKKSI
jgi:hypothetical protein